MPPNAGCQPAAKTKTAPYRNSRWTNLQMCVQECKHKTEGNHDRQRLIMRDLQFPWPRKLYSIDGLHARHQAGQDHQTFQSTQTWEASTGKTHYTKPVRLQSREVHLHRNRCGANPAAIRCPGPSGVRSGAVKRSGKQGRFFVPRQAMRFVP